jgi:CDP-4-dehydro-6-deoxyglucose reductase
VEGCVDPSRGIPAPVSFEEPYEVLGIERRTATIAELWLRPLGSGLQHRPGEYVLLEDDRHEVPTRSFSIANAARSDGLLSLLVTRVPEGESSRWIHERLRVGETVSVSGPYGT